MTHLALEFKFSSAVNSHGDIWKDGSVLGELGREIWVDALLTQT